mmetsp:Transcript_99594/g.253137  ORF Transcript_99594/g.253137 Transcript_99594/m.253137 type:complete len:286 (+) Transcript_99594:222-1079(+)
MMPFKFMAPPTTCQTDPSEAFPGVAAAPALAAAGRTSGVTHASAGSGLWPTSCGTGGFATCPLCSSSVRSTTGGCSASSPGSRSRHSKRRKPPNGTTSFVSATRKPASPKTSLKLWTPLRRSSEAMRTMRPPGASMQSMACAKVSPQWPYITSEARMTSARSSAPQGALMASSQRNVRAETWLHLPSLVPSAPRRKSDSFTRRLCSKFRTASSSPSVITHSRARQAAAMPARPQPAPTSTTLLPSTRCGLRSSSPARTMLADQSWQPVDACTPSAIGSSRMRTWM